jgi:TPR repeat protein
MRYYIDGYLEILNDNYKKAYDIYKAGIEKGDLNAEFGLAEMYYNGWYVEKDEQRAIQIFNKIYKPIHRKAKWHKNDSESQLIIFCLSEWDEQIKHFKDDFFEMLKKASGDKSNPVAKWYMGEKDFEIAGWGASALVKLNYERAAACPNTNRYKFDLAMYYKHGSDGVPQDHSKAFYWCKLAAEDGFSEAQLELSNMYLNGIGTKTNVEEYRRWRTIA